MIICLFFVNELTKNLTNGSVTFQKVPVEIGVESAEYKRAVLNLVTMIAPFAPMFSMECWSALKQVENLYTKVFK